MSGAVPLHVVSGKGGTGKTTVSLALAAVLARPGDEVLVCEVEDRHSLTEASGVERIPAGSEGHLFDAGAGRVSALSVDPRHALAEYLETHFRLGPVATVLDKAGFVEFATDLAPGLRDVLLVGKVYQAARRRGKGRDDAMDAVVLDAPPTGRLEPFLTAGDALADLVRVGPIHQQARSIMALLRSGSTRVHLVTTPTEMAVTETVAAMDTIERHGLGLGRVIVTMVHPDVPELGDVPGLSEAAADLLRARLASDRRLVEAQHRWLDAVTERMAASNLLPPVILPLLPTEVRPDMLTHLADLLAAQGGLGHTVPDPDTVAPPPAGRPTAGRVAPDPLRSQPTEPLGRLLDDRGTRVVVCCGTGGVGKTSVSAAFALRAAKQGRAVVLLTVDPAKRLATALGLDALGGEPERVSGIDGPGSLDALMLDMTHTFDAAVRAHAPAGQADEVLRNPFYKALSTSFSGTQDYMATELLGQLDDEARRTGRWDLIVIDTPPSRSALDFLDAPARVDRLAEGPLLQLLAPRSGPLRLLNVGMTQATRLVSRIIGGQALADLQVFATAFESVMGGFRRRADDVRRLLASDEAAFVVVASPRRTALREAGFLMERLASQGQPVRGVVVNQVTVPVPLSGADEEALRAAAPEVLAWWRRATRAHAAQTDEVSDELPGCTRPTLVPTLEVEVTDLAALRRLGSLLA